MRDNRIVSQTSLRSRDSLPRIPEYAATERARRAARVRVRPARRAAARLSRLHRRQPVRRVADARARALLDRPRLRQPALGEPRARPPRPTSSSRRAAPCSSYFNAPPDEYTAVFTANATGALKLVGEAYPFAPGGRFLLTFDNHNSVNGIREFARAKGARRRLRAADGARSADRSASASTRCSISADPHGAQPVRLSGAVELLRREAPARSDRARRTRKGWDVLLDAAAFVPTNRLDLRRGPARLRRRSRSTRCSAIRPASGCLIVRDTVAAEAAPPVVRRRHGQLRDGAGPRAHPGAARSRVRGRHAQLPRASRPWRSGCGISSASASRRSRRASRASPAGC